MPSMEDSRRAVQAGLGQQNGEPSHDDIIAGLQDEIDKHNAVKDDLRRTMGRSGRRDEKRDTSQDPSEEPSLKFRFKSTHSDPRKRKHRDRGDHGERRHHKRRRRKEGDTLHGDEQKEAEDATASHPFPREPTAPDQPPLHPNHAFRDSLFDALADDEGAQYWESVYSQPIHVYPRPVVASPSGELEQMDDDAYVAYVKMKMWERKNPEVVLGRERTERKRREAEERSAREREDFVRRKEQAAWGKAQRRFGGGGTGEDERYEKTFAGEGKWSQGEAKQESAAEYAQAWREYFAAWDKLKHDLLRHAADDSKEGTPDMSKCIPWPVLTTKPVLKPNIEAFMRHIPEDPDRGNLQLLKAERVRWHPDKVQQRFGGKVDEGTMKLVTGVFQVVDALFEGERAGTSK